MTSIEKIKEFIKILAIIALTIILRLPYSKIPFLNIDEADYAIVAKEWNRGKLPYRDVWTHKPPGIITVYAWIMDYFDNSMHALHIFTAIWSAGMGILIYFFSKRKIKSEMGFIAGLLWSVYSTTYTARDFLASNTEIFMVLPSLGGLWMFLRAMENGKCKYYFLTGILVSLAFLFKPMVIYELLLYIFYLIFNATKGKYYKNFLNILILIGAFLLPLGVISYYWWVKDGLSDLFNLVVLFNAQYSTHIHPINSLYRLFHFTLRIASWNFLLWIAGISGLFLAFTKRKSDPSIKILAFYFLAGMAGVSSTGRFFGHYYLQVIPSLVILTVFSLKEMLIELKSLENLKVGESSFFRSFLIFFFIMGILIPLERFHGLRWLRMLDYEIGKPIDEELQREIAFKPEDIKISQFIKMNSTKTDKIFIWGFYPQIYYFSDRQPASRFIYCNYLTGLSPGSQEFFEGKETSKWIVKGSWDKLIYDLEQNRPELIIDTSPADYWGYGREQISKYPRLNDFLQNNYQKLAEVEKVMIYKRINPMGE